MVQKFGQIFDIIDGDRGKNYPQDKDFSDSGYCLFLSASNVTKDGWRFDKCQFITKEKCNALRKGLISNGDIIFTSRGTVGNVALYDTSIPYSVIRINSGMVILREKDRASVNNRYAYYVLKSQMVKQLITYYCSGSAQPQLPIKDFIKIKIDLPPLPIQQKIASILSTYDNLIENNTKRIKLLEQMAENLYKEWFVRFRFPGHENVEMENGLPKGWTVEKLGDFCYVTDGTHDTPKQTEKGIPLVTGKCIKDGFIDFDMAYNISKDEHNKIKKRSGLESGDILFSNIGTIGNSCIVDYDREFSVKNVIILKSKLQYKTTFLYYWINNDTTKDLFSNQCNGASQQFIGLSFMRKYKLLIPTNNILNKFNDFVSPLLNEKINLRRQNEHLTRQRDLLLPRLMSGKLEVKA